MSVVAEANVVEGIVALEPWHLADVTLDPSGHAVYRAGRHIHMTKTEFAMLQALIANPGIVLASRVLQGAARRPLSDSNVRNVVTRIRRKLGEPWLIHNIYGVGYVMREVTKC